MSNPLIFYTFRGQPFVEPRVYSKLDILESVERTPVAISDVLVIGQFAGGSPDHVYRNWLTYGEIKDIHDPNGADAAIMKQVRLIKTPSPKLSDPGAGIIHTVRPGDPTQATKVLEKAGPATVITMTTKDYGVHTNFNKIKVENATDGVGKKISLGWKDEDSETITGDNLSRVFSIQYTGAAVTATVSVTNATGDTATRLQTSCAATPADDLDLDLTLPDYDTLAKVVSAISNHAKYTCAYHDTDVDVSVMPSSTLDAVGGASILVAAYVPAVLAAIVYWINQNSRRVAAVKELGETDAPVNIAAFEYFTSGTYPAVSTADYQDALTAAETASLAGGYIFVDSSDSAVQASVISFMSEQLDLGIKWRYCTATAANADTDAVVTAGKALSVIMNYTRVMVVAQSINDVEDSSVELAPIYLAAAMAGYSAGAPVTSPISLKPVRIGGIPDDQLLKPSQRFDALSNGVTVLTTKNGVPIIALAVSADLGDERIWRMWSESCAGDYMDINICLGLEKKKAKWAKSKDPALIQALVVNMLEGFRDNEGIITAGVDATGAPQPAFTLPVVTISAGHIGITWGARIGGEITSIGIKGQVGYAKMSSSLAI